MMDTLAKLLQELRDYGPAEVMLHILYRMSKNEKYDVKMLLLREKHLLPLDEQQLARTIEEQYFNAMHCTLHLDAPQTFTEKIQWLKLYDCTPEKTRLADKYLVRPWVAEKIGEEHLVPLLGVWDTFADIDLAALPASFCLKTNHGSVMDLVVKNRTAALWIINFIALTVSRCLYNASETAIWKTIRAASAIVI